MIVEIETVSFNTDPTDYVDTDRITDVTVEYETDNGHVYEKTACTVSSESLEQLLIDIDAQCIVDKPTSIRSYDGADWVVSVYDGYNE